jgi:exopolysaccharide biosynthesis WecB/TagA/CpsF family protein
MAQNEIMAQAISAEKAISAKKACGADKCAPGLRINLAHMDEAVQRLADDAQMGCGFTLFTLNLDHMLKIRINKLFRAAYARATYVSADGWPIVWLARRKGVSLERTTGADLVKPLCKEAAERGLKVYFLGSDERSLARAGAKLQQLYPGLEIVGMSSPQNFDPCSASADRAIEQIASSKADLCFLAFGAPKQELFADRAHNFTGHVGYLCIGAALDFIAGSQQRAPQWMQKTGTEWLYRLSQNPRRLATRYGGSLMIFAEMTLRQLSGHPDKDLDFTVGDIKK